MKRLEKAVSVPTDDKLRTLLQPQIIRVTKLLTRRGVLVEEMGQTYLAEFDACCEEERAAAAAGYGHQLPFSHPS